MEVREGNGVQQRAEKMIGDLQNKILASLACISRRNAFSTFESIEHILFKLQKYNHWVIALVISNQDKKCVGGRRKVLSNSLKKKPKTQKTKAKAKKFLLTNVMVLSDRKYLYLDLWLPLG